MKTNMLLLDNKIRKDDDGQQTPVVVPQTKQSVQAGMKALMFQGMKNLMANPGLAKEAGVMNESASLKNADSYVAPYSSNIAFQGVKEKAVMAGMAAV